MKEKEMKETRFVRFNDMELNAMESAFSRDDDLWFLAEEVRREKRYREEKDMEESEEENG